MAYPCYVRTLCTYNVGCPCYYSTELLCRLVGTSAPRRIQSAGRSSDAAGLVNGLVNGLTYRLPDRCQSQSHSLVGIEGTRDNFYVSICRTEDTPGLT